MPSHGSASPKSAIQPDAPEPRSSLRITPRAQLLRMKIAWPARTRSGTQYRRAHCGQGHAPRGRITQVDHCRIVSRNLDTARRSTIASAASIFGRCTNFHHSKWG
eukprot:1515291-Pleurochrysis_carterae.AAC.2